MLAGDTGKHCSQVLELSLHSQKSQDIPLSTRAPPFASALVPAPFSALKEGRHRGAQKGEIHHSLYFLNTAHSRTLTGK